MADPLDTFHSGQGRRHRLFTDSTDRLADDTQYVSQDVGTDAIQLDTGQAFYLRSINPTLWSAVGGSGGSGFVNQIIADAFSGTIVPGTRYILDAANGVAASTHTSAASPTVGDEFEVWMVNGSGMTTVTVARNGNNINSFAGDFMGTSAGSGQSEGGVVRGVFVGGAVGWAVTVSVGQ